MTSELENRKKVKPKTTPRFNDVRFVNYDLTEQERAACKVWMTDLSSLDDAVLKGCEQDYRFSVKWDEKTTSFACYMQSVSASGDNAGLLNTGRGSTPLRALKQALYKHFVVFDCQWGGYAERPTMQELDD